MNWWFSWMNTPRLLLTPMQELAQAVEGLILLAVVVGLIMLSVWINERRRNR